MGFYAFHQKGQVKDKGSDRAVVPLSLTHRLNNPLPKQPADLSIQLATDELLDLARSFDVRGFDGRQAGKCPSQLIADIVGVAIGPSTALL